MNTKTNATILVGALLLGLMIFPRSAIAQVAAEGAVNQQNQFRRITFDEALGLLGANLGLRIARLEAAEAEAIARQSKAYPNPAFTASHETLDATGELSESYLTLSQRLEWPGSRSARQTMASENALAASTRVAADSALLGFRVKRAYVEATRAETYTDILERVATVFRQAVERAGERYDEGDVSLYDLRRIEVERVRYEASLADALLDLSSARHELALLVAPETGDLQLAPAAAPVGMPPFLNLDQLQVLAVSRRPEIAAVQADIRSAQAEVRGLRAQRVPDLTATGGFRRQSDGFNGLFLGMSVPLPLWNRSADAIEAADARVTGEQTLLALTRREIENDAWSALDAYRSQVQRAELLSGEGGAQTTDLLDVAQVAYDAGEMELIELLDAAEAFRDAETATIRIRSDVWISYYDLERAVGGFGDLSGQGEDDE